MKKRILTITYYILAILLIGYILVGAFFPEKSIDFIGFRTFIVVSPSMEPDINVNDMIVIKKAKEDKLEVRDAITFLAYIPEVQEQRYVTHYIGEISTDTTGTTIYKTQGATKDPGDYDEWKDSSGNDVDVTFEDIEGVYLFRIPYVGYAVNALRDPIFIGLLAINVIVVYAVVKLVFPKKKTESEEHKKEIE